MYSSIGVATTTDLCSVCHQNEWQMMSIETAASHIKTIFNIQIATTNANGKCCSNCWFYLSLLADSENLAPKCFCGFDRDEKQRLKSHITDVKTKYNEYLRKNCNNFQNSTTIKVTKKLDNLPNNFQLPAMAQNDKKFFRSTVRLLHLPNHTNMATVPSSEVRQSKRLQIYPTETITIIHSDSYQPKGILCDRNQPKPPGNKHVSWSINMVEYINSSDTTTTDSNSDVDYDDDENTKPKRKKMKPNNEAHPKKLSPIKCDEAHPKKLSPLSPMDVDSSDEKSNTANRRFGQCRSSSSSSSSPSSSSSSSSSLSSDDECVISSDSSSDNLFKLSNRFKNVVETPRPRPRQINRDSLEKKFGAHYFRARIQLRPCRSTDIKDYNFATAAQAQQQPEQENNEIIFNSKNEQNQNGKDDESMSEIVPESPIKHNTNSGIVLTGLEKISTLKYQQYLTAEKLQQSNGSTNLDDDNLMADESDKIELDSIERIEQNTDTELKKIDNTSHVPVAADNKSIVSLESNTEINLNSPMCQSVNKQLTNNIDRIIQQDSNNDLTLFKETESSESDEIKLQTIEKDNFSESDDEVISRKYHRKKEDEHDLTHISDSKNKQDKEEIIEQRKQKRRKGVIDDDDDDSMEQQTEDKSKQDKKGIDDNSKGKNEHSIQCSKEIIERHPQPKENVGKNLLDVNSINEKCAVPETTTNSSLHESKQSSFLEVLENEKSSKELSFPDSATSKSSSSDEFATPSNSPTNIQSTTNIDSDFKAINDDEKLIEVSIDTLMSDHKEFEDLILDCINNKDSIKSTGSSDLTAATTTEIQAEIGKIIESLQPEQIENSYLPTSQQQQQKSPLVLVDNKDENVIDEFIRNHHQNTESGDDIIMATTNPTSKIQNDLITNFNTTELM